MQGDGGGIVGSVDDALTGVCQAVHDSLDIESSQLQECAH